jgi:hypothetical protein
VDEEFYLALLRDRLRDPFGGFSGAAAADSCPMSARMTQSSKLSSGTT